MNLHAASLLVTHVLAPICTGWTRPGTASTGREWWRPICTHFINQRKKQVAYRIRMHMLLRVVDNKKELKVNMNYLYHFLAASLE